MFASDPAAVRYLSGTRPFVVTGPAVTAPIPEQWDAVPVQSFTSVAVIEQAVTNGGIAPQTRALLYDCEAWEFTPAEEQHEFAAFNRRAAQIARAHDLLHISAPAVTLARVQAGPDGRRYQQFLDLGIPAQAAKDADVAVIQAQGSEPAPQRYGSFVRAAAEQARHANPEVLVFAGLSTNPSGQRVDANVIIRAIDATRQVVDGYWFNVPQRSGYTPRANEYRPDMAIEVFRRLTGFEE